MFHLLKWPPVSPFVSLHWKPINSTTAVQSVSDIVVFAIKFLMYSAAPSSVAHSVAKDDVVISTKGWVCIPLPEDTICSLPCRQQEKGEWWQRRAGKLLFLTPYQLVAPYRCHLLLSHTITRVALFTQPRHSISLPHPLSLLALSTGDPQQQTLKWVTCRWVAPHQQIEVGCV